MAKKCKFTFYSQSDKECVYTPSIGSDFCIWHDPEIKKDQEFVPLRLKSAIKETGGDLEGFLLRKADLSGLNLRDVDLRDADLREADLEGSDCRGADFRGAKLNRVSASSANFEGANFMAANLSDGVFGGTVFRDCNLRITNLGRADIRGADFTGSDLRNTDFSETHQDEKTNFYNVTGITAKIVKGEEPPAEKPSGGPPTTPMGPPDTQSSSVQAPAGGTPVPPEEGAEPFSDIFDNVGDSLMEGQQVGGQGAAADGPEPLIAREDNEGPSDAVEETGAEAEGSAEQTAVTSARSDEDETDFGIKLDGSSPLTKKHHFSPSRIKVAAVFILLFAAGAGIGIFVESRLDLMGTSSGTGTGEKTSELKKNIQTLTDDLAEKDRALSGIRVKLEGLKKEIADQKRALSEKEAAIRKLLENSGDNGSSGSSEAAALLEQKTRKLEEKLEQWRRRYESLSASLNQKKKKVIRMAVETTKLEKKIREITGTNKKVVQEKSNLERQLAEGKVLLEEYRERLKKAEDAYKKLQMKVPHSQDPFVSEHPGSFSIEWGTYTLIAPPDEKYIAGIKLSKSPDGGFLHADLMIVGKAPRCKPAFEMRFYDKKGSQLARRIKIDFTRKGIKYQEVKLMSRGWRHSEEMPFYCLVKFSGSE